MQRLGILAVLTLLLTMVWLTLLIVQMERISTIDTYEDALAYARDLDTTHYTIYLVTALLTVVDVALFAELYNVFRSQSPDWSLIALVFVPVYGTMNLAVYLSQVIVLPRLADAPSSQADTLLAYSVQLWADSPAAFVNLLAYTILGIPSVIFGVMMTRQPGVMRRAGILLMASGIAGFASLVEVLAQVEHPISFSVIGGVLFLLALVPLAWASLRPAMHTLLCLEGKAAS